MTVTSFSNAPIIDAVAQVRKVNSTWIVRGGLDGAAEEYLEYLEENDRVRLIASCTIAMKVVKATDEVVDPKALFYPGLFSLSNSTERSQFLQPFAHTREVVQECRIQLGLSMKIAHGNTCAIRGDEFERVTVVVVETIREMFPEGCEVFSA